jgi:hypothetical protein
MMLALLIYCYITKRMSSRAIEEATYIDIGARYICGNRAHPDHTVICRFRTGNREAFKEAFTKLLVMAQEMGVLKRIGGISVDGTKIHANASKHSAVSYKRAVEMIAEAEQEVAELLQKAEDADSRPLEDGLTIPDEIARREERKAALEEAKRVMEDRYAQAQAEREAAKAEQRKQKEAGKDEGDGAKSGKQAGAAKNKPLEEYQYNFTDPESRIMLTGKKEFEQCYNGQAAVDVESMLIVGGYVTNHGNDKQELVPGVESVDQEVYTPETVCADTGFYSEEAVAAVEQRDGEGKRQGPEVYCAVEKQHHHRSVKDLERQDDPPPPDSGAEAKEQMGNKLKTGAGKAVYKKRKETVEPVFGIIKAAMGFRQFLLRGLEKANLEWGVVTLAYNFKRLYALKTG